MDDDETVPSCGAVCQVNFGGYFLTHAIWRNSYGSYQPETGVRSKADDFKDFYLIQHHSDNWPMVTVVMLAALNKGWDGWRIGRFIEWLHKRIKRRRRT